MTDKKRGLNYLTPEEREKCIDALIAYFSDERGEDIGVIAAGDMADFFIDQMGSRIYNAAIEDAKGVFRARLEDVEGDFDVLKRDM